MSDNNTEDKEHNIIICGPQKENLTIKQFLQKKRFEELYDPVNHNVLYALHKTEKISDLKVLYAHHVAKDEFTYNSRKSRALLGLPLHGEITIDPSKITQGYRLYVQSTSWNRVIKAGNPIIIELTEEEMKKAEVKFGLVECEPDYLAWHTASIGTNTPPPAVEFDASFDIDDTTLSKKDSKSPKKPSPKKSPAAPKNNNANKEIQKVQEKEKEKEKKQQEKGKGKEKEKEKGEKSPKSLKRGNTMENTVEEGLEFIKAFELQEKKKSRVERRSKAVATKHLKLRK